MKTMSDSPGLLAETIELIHQSSANCVSGVLARICSETSAEFGVLLSSSVKGHLEFDAIYGYPDEDIRRARSERPLKLDASSSLCALVINDTRDDDDPAPRVFPGDHEGQYTITRGIRETLIYPIRLRGGTVGAIALETRNEGILRGCEADPHWKKTFHTYGRLVTLALQARQSVIYRFNEFLGETDAVGSEQYFDSILERVQTEFGIDTAIIYLLDWNGRQRREVLTCAAARVQGRPDPQTRGATHDLGEGYAGWIAKHATPLILPEFEAEDGPAFDFYEARVGERPRRCSKFLHRYPNVKIRSYAGFPLLGERNRLVGVLQAFNTNHETNREAVFSEERLLEMFARRLGRDLYDRVRQTRRSHLFNFPRIDTSSLQTVIRGVVDAAVTVTGATHGWYMQREVVDSDYFVPRGVCGAGLSKRQIPEVSADDPDDVVAHVSRTRKEIVCHDLEHPAPGDAEILARSFRPPDARSALVVPVYLKNPGAASNGHAAEEPAYDDLGVLMLFSYRQGAFQDDELVVTALADLVSYHIWGGRVRGELRAARAEVSRLESSVSVYNRVAAASAAAPGAVHTASKHVNQVQPYVLKLREHPRVRGDRELRELVDPIHKSLEELSRFHDRMHEIFALKPRFEPCSVRGLVDEVRGFMSFTFAERRITLRVSKDPEGLELYADHVLMKVVFINLIQNSIEAGARSITVRIEPTEVDLMGFIRPGVEVLYSDDGIGIARDEWKQIFEPFFTKNKERGSGTGLGMAVAKDVLSRHSGTIEVRESTLGQGVTFALRWPCRPPAPPPTPKR